MPRKSKETEKKQKVKNIIQNVVIKLDGEGKKAKRKRKRQPKKAPVQKEVISVTANVPPAVIYQQPAIQLPIPQAFTPNPPPPPFIEPISKTFLEEIEMPGSSQLIEVPTKKEQLQEMIEPVKIVSQVEKPPHVKPFKVLSSIEKPPLPQIKQEKQEQYKIVAPVEKPNIKISMTEPSFPLGISPDEFVPAGNFVNPDQLLKAQETPMKVYTEDPLPQNEVIGNTTFGIDTQQLYESQQAQKNKINEEIKLIHKRSQKVKEITQRGQEGLKQVKEVLAQQLPFNVREVGNEQNVLVQGLGMLPIAENVVEIPKGPIEKLNVRDTRGLYQKIYGEGSHKGIPVKKLRKRLQEKFNL